MANPCESNAPTWAIALRIMAQLSRAGLLLGARERRVRPNDGGKNEGRVSPLSHAPRPIVAGKRCEVVNDEARRLHPLARFPGTFGSTERTKPMVAQTIQIDKPRCDIRSIPAGDGVRLMMHVANTLDHANQQVRGSEFWRRARPLKSYSQVLELARGYVEVTP